MDSELGVVYFSGYYISVKDDKDFFFLVKEIYERGDMFNYILDRRY